MAIKRDLRRFKVLMPRLSVEHQDQVFQDRLDLQASVLGSRIFESSDLRRIEENIRTLKSNESIGEAKAPAREFPFSITC
jgi:hypothetical protein